MNLQIDHRIIRIMTTDRVIMKGKAKIVFYDENIDEEFRWKYKYTHYSSMSDRVTSIMKNRLILLTKGLANTR